MTDLATAAARALADAGRFVAVTGEHWSDYAAFVTAASLHVVAPGPTTRVGVAAGVRLAGQEAVVAVDIPPTAVDADASTLAVTTSTQCALAAVSRGWSVVQPWAAEDLPALLAAAPRPALLVLGAHRGAVDLAAPRPRAARQWQDGDLATLVGSGASVGPMVHLSRRLLARGVEVAVVEIAVLSSPAHAPLVGGETLVVAGPHTANVFRRGGWPTASTDLVQLSGADEAELVAAVLARVPAR